MPKVTKVGFGNGEIRYVGTVEPVKATSKTTGNVTINNAAQPGVKAHYKTSFMLSVEMDADGIALNNVFHWSGIVLSDDQNAPYRAIEDQAARQIAPMLRSAADEIDKHIAAFETTGSAKLKSE